MSYIINFINADLVPFVFAVAFAMFLFGVFQFYFLKGADAKSRQEGRGFIIGSIIAFAIMLSVWGLVNIVRGTVPFLNNNQPNLPGFNPTTTSGSGLQPATAPNVAPATAPNVAPATAPNTTSNQNCTNGNCADVQGLY